MAGMAGMAGMFTYPRFATLAGASLATKLVLHLLAGVWLFRPVSQQLLALWTAFGILVLAHRMIGDPCWRNLPLVLLNTLLVVSSAVGAWPVFSCPTVRRAPRRRGQSSGPGSPAADVAGRPRSQGCGTPRQSACQDEHPVAIATRSGDPAVVPRWRGGASGCRRPPFPCAPGGPTPTGPASGSLRVGVAPMGGTRRGITSGMRGNPYPACVLSVRSLEGPGRPVTPRRST